MDWIFFVALAAVAALSIVGFAFVVRSFRQIAGMRRNVPPFVPLPAPSVRALVDALSLCEDDVVMDLGCGDGRILKEILRRNPGVRVRGVDHDRYPLLLARMALRREIREGRCELSRGDLFAESLHDVSKVVTYLFPETMDALLPKLERELAAGALLVSADFRFSTRQPDRTVVVAGQERKLGKHLHLWRF